MKNYFIRQNKFVFIFISARDTIAISNVRSSQNSCCLNGITACKSIATSQYPMSIKPESKAFFICICIHFLFRVKIICSCPVENLYDPAFFYRTYLSCVEVEMKWNYSA